MIGTSIISMISWLTADSSADWNFATLMTINDYSGFEGFLYSTLLSLALVLPIIVGNVILFATTWPLAANLERHHSQTSMELHMMFKMTFFQVFNSAQFGAIRRNSVTHARPRNSLTTSSASARCSTPCSPPSSSSPSSRTARARSRRAARV